jgi:hypothetical protein
MTSKDLEGFIPKEQIEPTNRMGQVWILFEYPRHSKKIRRKQFEPTRGGTIRLNPRKVAIARSSFRRSRTLGAYNGIPIL